MATFLEDLRDVLVRGPRIYFTFDAEHARLLDSKSGRSFEDRPELIYRTEQGARWAISCGSSGLSEATPDAVCSAPFSNPRLVVDDLDSAAAIFRFFFWKVIRRPVLRPDIVMHPLRKFEGGLSSSERSLLLQLGRLGGAVRVGVHEGDLLSRAELEDFACERVELWE